MIGRKFLPCGHQRVRLPEEPGEHQRRCDICKQHYIATVSHSTYWTLKLGTPQLVVHWDDEGAFRPLEPPVDSPEPASTGLHPEPAPAPAPTPEPAPAPTPAPAPRTPHTASVIRPAAPPATNLRPPTILRPNGCSLSDAP